MKLRVASCRKWIPILMTTRLHFIGTRPKSACSTFSGSPPRSTRWLSARARYWARRKKHTNLPEHPAQSVRICIVCSSAPFASRNMCARTRTLRAAQCRLDRPLFIIDIAVPRDVDPSVNKMAGVYLYDIDSLQSVAEQSLALRRQQIAAAESIIADHVADFVDSISRGLHPASQTGQLASLAKNSLRASEL